MNNAEKFKQLFGIYATELWAMPEEKFLEWLNAEALEKQEQDRWRPVSEALPKKEAEYNVTIKDEYGPPYVGVCYWNDNDNVFEDWDGYYEDRVTVSNVIAWRPLPELYKEDKT